MQDADPMQVLAPREYLPRTSTCREGPGRSADEKRTTGTNVLSRRVPIATLASIREERSAQTKSEAGVQERRAV